MDERQWIQAIQKGNKQYLQDIVEKYYDDIFRFCTFQTGSREDAYDLAQETFLRFIRYVEGYRHRNLKGYLLTIAMNLCRDFLSEKCSRGEREISFDRKLDSGNPLESSSLWDIYRAEDMFPGESEESPESKLLERDMLDSGNPLESSSLWDIYRAEDMFPGESEESPESKLLERDMHDRLMDALSCLPKMQREAILLHYLYDMKYREIAKITEVSVSTVKSRVKQGTEKLREIMKKEDFLDV